MDFALSEEQTAIFDMACAFGQEHIAPFARDWEKAGTIPKDFWPKVAELGFGGLYVSEDAGGTGLSRLDATLVFPTYCCSEPPGGPSSESPEQVAARSARSAAMTIIPLEAMVSA